MKKIGKHIAWGMLLGMVAALLYMDVIAIHPATIMPIQWREAKIIKEVEKMLSDILGRPMIEVTKGRFVRRAPSGVEEWEMITKRGKDFPVLIVNGTDPVTLGILPRPLSERVKKVAMKIPSPAPGAGEKKFAVDKIDTSGPPTIQGDGPLAVEYYSVRCPACLRMSPKWKRFVGKKHARLYAKLIARPGDEAALRVFAILRRARDLGADTWWALREMLHSKMIAGMDAASLDEELREMRTVSSPPVRKVLETVATKKDEAEAKRIWKEAEAVGIEFVPTYFVNGRRLDPKTLYN